VPTAGPQILGSACTSVQIGCGDRGETDRTFSVPGAGAGATRTDLHATAARTGAERSRNMRGRDRNIGARVSLAAAVLALAAAAALAGEQVVFFDDFETTPVGTLPANWQIIYGGRVGEQRVTQDVAHSGVRSLQLWGWPGWSALVVRNFASTSPLLGYEFRAPRFLLPSL
jgi:hypothetical protein